MRSDWHRYNLKRRVASLPPLSSEVFAEKVLSAQANSSAAAAKASFERACQPCQKTYYSENAYQNHLGSQRHRVKVAGVGNDQDTEPGTPSIISSTISLGDPVAPENVGDPETEADFTEVVKDMKKTKIHDEDSDAGDAARPSRPHHPANDDKILLPISPSRTPSSVATRNSAVMSLTRCIFCNHDAETFKLNLVHMTKVHAMFVPEQEYLSDLEGLVSYLQAKVTENYECLFCHKLKNSVAGVQTHMRDKGHTMIAFDSEEEMLEIGQFYDFRSTYSDSDSDDDDDDASSTSTAGPTKSKPSKGSKLGAHRPAAASGSAGDDEEGWETDSADESDASDETSDAAPRVKSHRVAYLDGHELHLPSGRTAGHRSLARYYRQNLRDYPSAAERAERQQKLLEDGGAEQQAEEGEDSRTNRQVVSRADGGLGMLGMSDATKRQVAALARKQVRTAQRSQNQYSLGVQQRANNQKYFRDDNFGIRH